MARKRKLIPKLPPKLARKRIYLPLVFLVGLVVGDWLYTGLKHGLDCEELPTIAKVEQVVDERQDVIEAIEELQGHASPQSDPRCPEKGYIDIRYPTKATKIVIQSWLADDLFYGIPVDLILW